MVRKRILAGLTGFTLITTFVFAGCDSVGSVDSDGLAPEMPGAGEMVVAPPSNNGNLRVLVTDAPFWFDHVEEALVTIHRIELYNREDGIVVVWPDDLDDYEPLEFNLIDLRDGITAEVSEVLVPPGDYHQIRVIVDGHGSVVTSDGTVYDLKIPSGEQTGIKINTNGLDIDEDEQTTILLDIPLEESFVVKGNPDTPAGIKGFNFKPVIHLKDVSKGDIWFDRYEKWEGFLTVSSVSEDGLELILIDADGTQYVVRKDSVRLVGISWEDLLALTDSHEVEIGFVRNEDGTLVVRRLKF